MCQNCRCGKAEHNVRDLEDPGFYFVGKIFDRPLRTRQEEMEFCYGDLSSSDEGGGGHHSDDSSDTLGSSGRGGRSKRAGGLKKGSGGQRKTVRFEWVPPNISISLVSAISVAFSYVSLQICVSQNLNFECLHFPII